MRGCGYTYWNKTHVERLFNHPPSRSGVGTLKSGTVEQSVKHDAPNEVKALTTVSVLSVPIRGWHIDAYGWQSMENC